MAELARAQRARASGDLEEARRALDAALAIDPGNVQALEWKAELPPSSPSGASAGGHVPPSPPSRTAVPRATRAPSRPAPRQVPPSAQIAAEGAARGGWTAFEQRVRERRAQHCVAAAERALADGDAAAAGEALDELALVAPDHPRLGELQDKVASRPAPHAVSPVTHASSARAESLPIDTAAVRPAEPGGVPAPDAAPFELPSGPGAAPWTSLETFEPESSRPRPRVETTPSPSLDDLWRSPSRATLAPAPARARRRRRRFGPVIAAGAAAAVLGAVLLRQPPATPAAGDPEQELALLSDELPPLETDPPATLPPVEPADEPGVTDGDALLPGPAGAGESGGETLPAPPSSIDTTAGAPPAPRGADADVTPAQEPEPPLPAPRDPAAAEQPAPSAGARSSTLDSTGPAADAGTPSAQRPDEAPPATSMAAPASSSPQPAPGSPARREMPSSGESVPSAGVPESIGTTGVRSEPAYAAPSAAAAPAPRPEVLSASAARSAPVQAPPDVAAANARAARSSRAAEEAVQQVLQRYVNAYNHLDASAARAVWPGVDGAALERAFSQLSAQTLKFDRCTIAVDEDAGRATCAGQAEWVPRVGGRDGRQERRTWRFDLARNGDDWIITRAEARR